MIFLARFGYYTCLLVAMGLIVLGIIFLKLWFIGVALVLVLISAKIEYHHPKVTEWENV